MTTTKKINEWHDSPSDYTQDADWVIVKEDGHLANEGFELIDAAEAQCWCGGSDTEHCRQSGHCWPLCDIDKGDFWPEQLDEICHQPHEKDETASTTTTDDESSSEQSSPDDSKETTPKPKPQNMIHPPGFYESGPFTRLAVLTDILETGRYPRV